MKKTIIAFGIALLATACTNKPMSVSHEGIELDFEVELLFEKEGIKMYRFYDNGRYHYYTNSGETISSYSTGGKFSQTYSENIK
jgi:hypothetical protein